MAVVGTGSLCAGPKELPTGFYRQYTVIELADNLQSARVHVRQMETAQLFSRAHLNSVGGRSYVDLEWEIPKEIAARLAATAPTPHAQVIIEAERSVKNQRFPDAVSLLEPLMVDLERYGRTVFFEAAVGAGRWDLIIKHGHSPQSIQELMNLVEAYDQTHQVQRGKEALALYGEALKMPEAMTKELQKRLVIREMQTK